MNVANHFYLAQMLLPICADPDDDGFQHPFPHLIHSDEGNLRELIRREIRPFYLGWDETSQQIARDSLQYYLNKKRCVSQGDSFFRDIYYMFHPIVFPPDEPKMFFIWMWEEIFGPVAWEVSDLLDYVESNAIDELNNIRYDRSAVP